MTTTMRVSLFMCCAVMGLAGAGCSSTTSTTPTASPTGSWIPDTKGPWDGAIYRTTSEDGLTFNGKTLVVDSAGVPNLLRLTNGDLVLTYQYFSSVDEDMFDVIAYATSDDNGETWSTTKAVTFRGLPSPVQEDKMPMDPTLVEEDDGSLRLYFTYHAKGARNAALYSASTADGIASTFVVEPTPALTLSEHLLDPAVVYFNNTWHHYSWRDGSDKNVHSTSMDGKVFTRQDDVELTMDFLGQVIAVDGGLRFYGTGAGNVVSAFTTDGSTWTMEPGNRAFGADPGIQQLEDGTYLMIYTSMNFNE